MLGPHVGYLPQHTGLFAGTVAENIARMASRARPRGWWSRRPRLAGVHELILRLPKGYDTLLGEDGAPLSAGQRQRLGLARDVYGDPKLVVLDEPNAHLDGAGEQALAGALRALKERRATVVLVTHRLNILRHADRILVLENGGVEPLRPARRDPAASWSARRARPERRMASPTSRRCPSSAPRASADRCWRQRPSCSCSSAASAAGPRWCRCRAPRSPRRWWHRTASARPSSISKVASSPRSASGRQHGGGRRRAGRAGRRRGPGRVQHGARPSWLPALAAAARLDGRAGRRGRRPRSPRICWRRRGGPGGAGADWTPSATSLVAPTPGPGRPGRPCATARSRRPRPDLAAYEGSLASIDRQLELIDEEIATVVDLAAARAWSASRGCSPSSAPAPISTASATRPVGNAARHARADRRDQARAAALVSGRAEEVATGLADALAAANRAAGRVQAAA